MTPAELLAKLERLNVKVSLAGDKLRLEAPAGALTPELKEIIRQQKYALIAFLKTKAKPQLQEIPSNWSLIKIYSRVLGEHVYFARDKKAAAKVKDAVIYTLPELRQLVLTNTDAEQLRRVHKAKKLFGGELVAKGDIKWKQKPSKA